jgi:hypothetical protein
MRHEPPTDGDVRAVFNAREWTKDRWTHVVHEQKQSRVEQPPSHLSDHEQIRQAKTTIVYIIGVTAVVVALLSYLGLR